MAHLALHRSSFARCDLLSVVTLVIAFTAFTIVLVREGALFLESLERALVDSDAPAAAPPCTPCGDQP